MRLVTFEKNGKEQPGVLTDEGRKVLAAGALGLPYGSMAELIKHLTKQERAALEKAAEGAEGYPLTETVI